MGIFLISITVAIAIILVCVVISATVYDYYEQDIVLKEKILKGDIDEKIEMLEKVLKSDIDKKIKVLENNIKLLKKIINKLDKGE